MAHHDGATGDQDHDEDDKEDAEQQGGDVQVLGGGAIAEGPTVVSEKFSVPGLQEAEGRVSEGGGNQWKGMP